MRQLIFAFLKIFFRNPRAIFFAVFLPAGIFFVAAFLGLRGVIQIALPLSYQDFLLSGILAMALMQTGIYTVGYTMIDYRRSGILKRLFVTPLSPEKFLWAQIFARFAIALAQSATLLLLGWLVFHTPLNGLLPLLLLIFVGNTIFLNFGFIIASIARDYEEAAPYTAILGLPLLFLGDVFFPVQNLPRSLAMIADYLPLKPLSGAIRHFLLGLPLPSLSHELLVLLVWFVISIALAQFLFRKKVYK